MGYREDLEESNRSDKDPLAQLVCVAVVVATYWYAYSDKGREIIFNSTEYESSEIDWCEDNYAWSPHVVEWWNSLSSVPMIFVAHKMRRLVRKGPSLIRPSSFLIPFSFLLIGLGSTYFHATLSAAGQILDEMPINLTNFYAITGLRSKSKLVSIFGNRWTNILRSDYFALTFVVVVPVASILVPMISHVLCVLSFPVTTYFVLSGYFNLTPEQQKYLKPCYHGAIFGMWGAGACWLLDKLGCEQMHMIQEWTGGHMPQFHAMWHLLVFWGAWHTGCLLFAIMAYEENIPKHKWGFVAFFPGEQRWFLPKVADWFATRMPGNLQFRMLEDLDGVAIKW